MASGGTVPVEKEWQQIEEEITCSICGDLFTDPKTIACLHTFCKRCIEKSIESNKKMASIVCCPLCRAPLPRDDMSSVPTNCTINRLVEIFGKRKEAGKTLVNKELKCSTCVDGLTAVTWCIECENSLCRQCNDAHQRMKAFRSHTTVAIEEFVKNPKLVLSTPEKPEACKSHNKQPLDLYCRTCSSLICHYCTLKDHPRETHNFDFIDDVVDEERETIKQATIPLKQLLERVRNGIKRIEESETEVDIESEANRGKIQGAYSEIYKLLKQQEEEALEKVNTIKMSLKKILAMQKENIKFMENQLLSCMEFSHDATSANRRRQLLIYKNLIINRVKDLTKQVEQTSIDPECRADDMMVRCVDPAEFISNCLCHISGVPHSPRCNVRGPLAISDPVKVTVTLKDIYGFSVVQQSKDLEIRCNKEGEFLQNVRIEEKSKGVYHIWYNPKRKEHHLLSVYWRGLVVNDEEVKVLVNIRDYANIKQEVKVIDKYGPNNEQLKYPYLIAKGPNNELIIRNDSTNQLVIFDDRLQYSNVIGGRGNGNGKFQCITGIAVDNKGYLYVADRKLHCIQKLTMNGQFVSQFGSEGTAEGQFKAPLGLVLSQSELLFVCDGGNHRIQVLKNVLFSYTFGQYGKKPGYFHYPRDLTLNSNEDQLFITDGGNYRVQVFTPSGQFLKIFGKYIYIPFRLQGPVGIYYTPDNHLLISSYYSHCVSVFEEDGRFVSAIKGSYQGRERFSKPCGVIMMNNGQIVIASASTHKLVVF